MNKSEIIQKAFGEGFLLSPKVLERAAAAGEIESVLGEAKQNGGLVITACSAEGPRITVRIKKFRKKTEVIPQEIFAFYDAKYSAIRDMLRKKLSPVSINKAIDTYSDVCVIGMVREMTSQGFMLEDQTGEIDVISGERPGLDDVVGIRGVVREKRLVAQEMVWPDVPLASDPGRIAGLTMLLSERGVDSGADLIFTLEPNGERTIHVNTNPGWVDISKGAKKIQLLVYRPPKNTTVKEASMWLRKRYLPHARNSLVGPDNPFLLKKVPTIIWVVTDEPGQEFYKGVTLISPGKGKVRMELGGMKAEFLD